METITFGQINFPKDFTAPIPCTNFVTILRVKLFSLIFVFCGIMTCMLNETDILQADIQARSCLRMTLL